MLSEYSQKKLEEFIKFQRDELDKGYLNAEVYEKIKDLKLSNTDLHIYLASFDNLVIYYNFKKDDKLEYITNYILEKIEEKIEFDSVRFQIYPDLETFDFTYDYKGVKIRITFNISKSENFISLSELQETLNKIYEQR